ncbi:MAG TPA: 50S ribosomal protein L11 [Sulfurovum sp.]|jgi:large subunit ribosomal protein L11|nr:MAG: 50S ribosomal protein L11 [Sulfurovum sp. 35-42-20]OYZ26453.1 MAG: 50S ribosomal protein L11 [Sulfurovum sp. 16-42-52]OYZ50107.1 MAG: 50S ribosomal protein L11 [Sulfurovum sp. 24-42-9]OZA46345.1 MAG: 50S ribosomal protein L11 [Sulfurovum sp. 17-42-90]OZA60438.1 MAG: 50S ribosomal protein L11 [Sulfurovum sp. 39-42-12]HQR73225.1 50S ribosomal protein L11 [Sulfurovum sp.]
MAKKVAFKFKLMIPAGAANPSPPVGPALGQRGVNIMEFCKAFNEKTKDKMGFKVPVVITVYADKSFTFETKQPPASDLIMKAAGLKKGTDNPILNKVGTITKAKLDEIVAQKIVDLNTNDKEMAARIIAGSCRSMGVTIVD